MPDKEKPTPQEPQVLRPIQGMNRDNMTDFRPVDPQRIPPKEQSAKSAPLGVRESASTYNGEAPIPTEVLQKLENGASAEKVTQNPQTTPSHPTPPAL